MTEQMMPQNDLVQEHQARLGMKKTFARIGWSLFTLIAVWYGVLLSVSVVCGVLEAFGIPILGFYERYMLVFNELGLAIGILAAMLVLKPLPKYEIEGERISAPRFLKYILVGLAIGFVGNMIGSGLLTLWNGMTGNEAGTEVDDLLLGSNYLLLLLMVGIAAPFLEEFFFRKLLIDHTRQYGELTCILTSGLLFGLFHGNFTQFFYAFGVGALFAYVYLRSGSFLLTFIFHSVFNIVSGVLPAILMGMGEEAEMAYTYVYLMLVLAGAALAIASFRGLKLRKGEVKLPAKGCVSAVILNSGMIVSILVMLVLMIMSLFTLDAL